jgi:hypothetical protein
MRMKNFILILLFLLLFSNGYSQVPIRIKEYGIFFTAIKCQDELKIPLQKDNQYALINLFDCKGAMHIDIFNGKNKIESGSYINSIDTLKEYVTKTNIGINTKSEIIVKRYFQPIRDGEWFYYNKLGHVYKKENYVKGIIKE